MSIDKQVLLHVSRLLNGDMQGREFLDWISGQTSELNDAESRTLRRIGAAVSSITESKGNDEQLRSLLYRKIETLRPVDE